MQTVILEIVISIAIAALVYVVIFHRPDYTQNPSRKTTNDDVIFPGNPAMIRSKDQLKTFSLTELHTFDGKDGKPIYISIGGKVFDCSAGTNFYGEGGPYEKFAGHDISLAAAKFSKEEKYLDVQTLENITPAEKDSFFHFYNMLYGKYHIVGLLEGNNYAEQLKSAK